MKRQNPIAACGFALLFALWTIGCSNDSSPSPPTKMEAVERTAQRGPVTLTVRADRSEISVSESLPLIVEVVAEPNVEIEMPRFAADQQLGAFDIVESTTPPDIPDQNKRRWTHQYVLRTLESGEQEIPAITVKFKDRRNVASPDQVVEQNELSTDSLTIRVHSLLPGDFNPNEFRDIKAEVDVPVPWNVRAWVYAGGAALMIVAIIAAIVYALSRKRRERIAAAPPLPPHVWALQQLDRLASEHLLERGDPRSLHEFFFRLSAIVRQYIERRFTIMAAEQTTDEFLREARRHPALSDAHRTLLTDFLQQADMVKFAKFQPPREQSEAAMAAARRFIAETAQSGDMAIAQAGAFASPHSQTATAQHAEVAA